jgi:hypothetical protein
MSFERVVEISSEFFNLSCSYDVQISSDYKFRLSYSCAHSTLWTRNWEDMDEVFSAWIEKHKGAIQIALSIRMSDQLLCREP